MGARHSSTSAAYYHNRSLVTGPATGGEDDGGRQFAQEILESCDPQLAEQYNVDGYMFPGSGRMMRTFRLRHKKNGSLVVVKLMWVTFDDEDHEMEDDRDVDEHSGKISRINATKPNANNSTEDRSTLKKRNGLYTQQRELSRVFRALKRHSHMAPFLYWKAGPEILRDAIPLRPALLLRPYFYTTLSDRLASRPFLTHVEKLWIVFQLLRALDDLHSSTSSSAALLSSNNHEEANSGIDSSTDTNTNRGGKTEIALPIVHGFLTTENIGLSSWNWVVLLDLSASYKGRTALPDDDPSEYLYYFQERQTGSSQSNNVVTTKFNDGYNNNSSFSTSAQSGGSTQQTSSLTSATSTSSLADLTNNNNNHIGASRTTREKRCYLAPERFYTPENIRNEGGEAGDNLESLKATSSSRANLSSSNPRIKTLTPEMDVFSAGCIIMETFLNGERAFDLGDLMEYRQRKAYTPTLQQKLNKIEFSALRAACKHMLSLDPSQRLPAREYLNRLEASALIPKSFYVLERLLKEVTTDSNLKSYSNLEADSEATVITPDARLAKAAAYYSEILYETVGIFDEDGKAYFDKVLGRTAVDAVRGMDTNLPVNTNKNSNESNVKHQSPGIPYTATTEKWQDPEQESLFQETEALLRKLEALTIDEGQVMSIATKEATTLTQQVDMNMGDDGIPKDSTRNMVKRSELSESSLLVYLQLILSTVRHVQRSASKLVALELMKRVGQHTTDEARLQRIVPVAVSLLQDQDSLVRASAINVLTSTISIVESFPPSDSKIFPQYIFKRVAHLVTDPSLVVRLSFARNVAMLADIAHKFLDISHAVRLYEDVGGGGSNVANSSKSDDVSSSDVFGDDVAKLLGESSSSKSTNENPKILNRAESTETTASDIMGSTRALISSAYNSDLDALHETVSRWVIHITTDVSEHSSPAKRALLADIARLCNFFGLNGVMAFILPQILSFLNDRKDWQLRASLFKHLPSVCHFIGRAATEHFVLPILETALVDCEEMVTSRALLCLSELLQMRLLSRGVFLGRIASHGSDESPGYVHFETIDASFESMGVYNLEASIQSNDTFFSLLKKYGALLMHPSLDIRLNFILNINELCKIIGPLDAEVFAIPIISPYLRFLPHTEYLQTPQGIERCLYPAWTRERFENELKRLVIAMESSSTAGQWTTIAVQINDGGSRNPPNVKHDLETKEDAKENSLSEKESNADDRTVRFCAYLQMLARSRIYGTKMSSVAENTSNDMEHAIEGSLKLAQQLKFPRQDISSHSFPTLPAWYGSLLESQNNQSESIHVTSAIRSVSALGKIYGLSIMDHAATTKATFDGMSTDCAMKFLYSNESKSADAACRGEWGSETCLNPALTDTSLLLTKLNALEVPPLPPRLSEERPTINKASHQSRHNAREVGDPRDSQAWRPKIDNVIATSIRASGHGHTAPIIRMAVAHDQSFFVSGSHDGTCRVWESEKAETSNGTLESSLTYSMGDSNVHKNLPRVNDLVMVEGSHSVASAGSDGSVHVWRVDLISSSSTNITDSKRNNRRVAGSTNIKRINPSEGEILAVNQFNNQGSSLITYATEKGSIHSWDLRSAKEPFCLKSIQDVGYVTNMAIGNDRNWVVVGTNKGFISLWDLRFHQVLRLWQHSRSTPINRLATSFVPPPQSWASKRSTYTDSKPHIFVASGPNECAMFDATTGHCSECFRTVEYRSKSPSSRIDDLPSLYDVSLSSSTRRKTLLSQGRGPAKLSEVISASFRSVNCMIGSTGNSDHSFLITGGSDRRIRFWDFAIPSKCHVTNGLDPTQPLPSFERIDYGNNSRLMLCHQAPTPAISEVDSFRVPRKLFQGTRTMSQGHDDSICDLKILKHSLLSCSRDCTVKLWR